MRHFLKRSSYSSGSTSSTRWPTAKVTIQSSFSQWRLGLLEPARERVDDVAGDGRLLGEDQGLHAVHHSNGSRGHRRLKSRFL